ncbi:MAG: hypothetical protein VB072_13680 [Lentimicrobium sp.]|nr:hypothetical protein [Lentimicrobium sp.]
MRNELYRCRITYLSLWKKTDRNIHSLILSGITPFLPFNRMISLFNCRIMPFTELYL